jgi:Zn-dependent peptidase ImmA (M78 family)/transcriptional regulator with XRE-family HTH domain
MRLTNGGGTMTRNNLIELPGAARAAQAGRRLIPGRLRDARRALRFTQRELGERAGVTRQSISAYEAGDKLPEPEIFSKLISALQQPTSYFTTPDLPLFGQLWPRFFRKVGPDTLRRNEACTVYGNWFIQIAKYIDDYVNYPQVDIARACPSDPGGRYSENELDHFADETRKYWKLGLGPISNVLALLESKGILVCRHVIEDERVDAFSFWNGDRPFIFMASEKVSAARIRFDLAHELGHLVLHRWIEPEELEDPKTLKLIEAEADHFASAFLLPRRSFPNEVYTAKLDAFVDLKRRWRVSMQAMIYRCRDLELIDEDQFTNLYKQISYRKWRSREPLDDPALFPLEQPRLLRRAVELILDGERKHPDEILADLNFSPHLIETFCNLPGGALVGEKGSTFRPTLK